MTHLFLPAIKHRVLLVVFMLYGVVVNAATVDDLLGQVRQMKTEELANQQQRVQHNSQILAQIQERQAALKNAVAAAKQKQISLLQAIETGNKTLKDKRQQLAERSLLLQDLYATWQQVLKDSLQNQKGSLITAQYPQAFQILQQLQSLNSHPRRSDLSRLTDLLQKDIEQTGFVGRYAGQYTNAQGVPVQAAIARIGPFSVAADGKLLSYSEIDQSLSALGRQPENGVLKYVQDAGYLAQQAVQPAVIDPSRGAVLQRLSLSPDWQERLQQGGLIGYVIIFLGVCGVVLAIWRWSQIGWLGIKVRRQLKNLDTPNPNNPLGRILGTYLQNQHIDTDTLEVKIQQLVMQEVPKLDRGLGMLKLLAAVAPMLGLLGTVVGMIATFQTITLVGSNDPKLMAAGISQALVTTVLGLIVAVPLLFSHSFVSSRVRGMMLLLSQQSLGLIAEAIENKQVAAESQNHA